MSYKKDSSLYYSLDHLAKPEEILSKGADDCDGKAVLICMMLLKRGYDAYVVMGTEHTWVEVNYLDRFVYIAHIECENPVLISEERLPAVRSTYAIFNMAEINWKPLGLIIQGAMIFFYTFLVLLLAQTIYVNRLHEAPINYISEIFGYFRYIMYMIIMIFLVWVFILLLVNYLFTIQ
ncbi:MAG: hypothetical protein JW825_03300 [Candidatus Methanofastidiosa archaeon]|nr:hypothetical protein [Candidatus Methanofastidiosa archaeon]